MAQVPWHWLTPGRQCCAVVHSNTVDRMRQPSDLLSLSVDTLLGVLEGHFLW